MSGYIPPQSIPGNQKKKPKKKKKAPRLPGDIRVMDSIFDARNQAGSIAEAIEKQAARLKGSAEANMQQSFGDPFSALSDQLFNQVNSINVAPTPLEELRRMAIQQVAAQFDPMIAALKNEMKTREGRAERSQGQARDMYGALSSDYMSELPALTEQFAQEDKAIDSRYDQAQQQMRSEYQNNAQEQNALLKQLGIQAAAPEASQQARDDQSYFQNQFELEQQSMRNAMDQQQNSAETYQRNLGDNAKMAGENLASDIGQQLEDFLSGANSQMTQLQGQRGSAIEALLAQMQQQDSQRVAQQRQQEFDNMMKLFNFQLDATNSSMRNAGGAGTGFGADGTLTTGLPGAQNYLASVYPDQPILASNLMEQINDVLGHKEVTDGKFILDPGDPAMGKSPKYSDVGQERMMDLLRREFEKENGRYSTGDINATLAALQAYLGKLR